jgi:hypothetical protein
MILDVLIIVLGVLALLNLWVTWRVTNDELATSMQRVTHILLIRAVPFLGALIILHLQRRHPEAHSGHYREVPDPGDDFGFSGRSHRHVQRGVDGGPDSPSD